MQLNARSCVLLAALAMAVGLAGCGGGGGGGTTPSSVSLGGTAAAGIFINADVKVYDATVGTGGSPLATGTTGADGKYSVSLPADFSKPLMIIVSAKPDGSSTTKDEVFGTVTMPAGFSLCSVVPAGAYTGDSVTGYVTPYTNLMCEIVKNKVGSAGVDDAINQARNLVNQLTGNVDPLNTDPTTDPDMVVRLAAVSNMAKQEGNPCNDSALSDGAKIQCTVEELAGLIEPMAADAPADASLDLDVDADVLADLAAATGDLDPATVSGNTGMPEQALGAGQQESADYLTEMEYNVGNNDGTITAPPSATATALEQAKAFFASLRAGILPYVNGNGDGYLQKQGEMAMDETYALNMASINNLDTLTTAISWAHRIAFDGEVPSVCTTGDNINYSCSMYVPSMDVVATVNLVHDTTNHKLTWSVPSSIYAGMIAYTATSMTVNGWLPGFTDGANAAKIGNPGGVDVNAAPLVMSMSTVGEVTKFSFEGSIKDMACTGSGTSNCTALMKFSFNSGSYLSVRGPVDTNPGPDPEAASITGTFITPNYRYIGTLTASGLQIAEGSRSVVGGIASFTGTVNGITVVEITNPFAYMTAYVLFGLLRARDAGVQVNEDQITRAIGNRGRSSDVVQGKLLKANAWKIGRA
ncbi:MAG: hypothetical protein HGA75_18520, partial [Thiobacillus sp.]|nr:hypothetical protein [Thiobacillus sp.]